MLGEDQAGVRRGSMAERGGRRLRGGIRGMVLLRRRGRGCLLSGFWSGFGPRKQRGWGYLTTASSRGATSLFDHTLDHSC